MSKNPLKQAEALLGHFKPVDLDCAYTLLYALGQQDTVILGANNVDTTPRRLYANKGCNLTAHRLKIKFYGGPVGQGKWYPGTFHSFVLDCIAAKIQMEGFDTTRRLLRVR